MTFKTGDIIKTQNSKYEHEEEYGYVANDDERFFYVYWFDDGITAMIYRYSKKNDKETFIKVS